MDTNLHYVYLENYSQGIDDSHNMLKKLIGDKDVKKLVLQPCLNDKGEMTLIVWSTKDNNKPYEKHVEVLAVHSEISKDADISGKIVRLGNQEISDKRKTPNGDKHLQVLRDSINQPGHKYVFFEPHVESDGSDNDGNAFKLYYQLYYTDTIASTLNLSLTPYNVSCNPSPPAPAD